MQEDIHSTAPPPPKSENWIVVELKKNVVSLMIGGAIGLYMYLNTARDSQMSLTSKVETNTRNIERLMESDKEEDKQRTEFLLSLNNATQAINRLAIDVKKIQDQQEKNTEQLLNRR